MKKSKFSAKQARAISNENTNLDKVRLLDHVLRGVERIARRGGTKYNQDFKAADYHTLTLHTMTELENLGYKNIAISSFMSGEDEDYTLTFEW